MSFENIKNEKSEYELQTEKFLEETGTTIVSEYEGNGLFFPDDKESRDIYKITLKRNGKKYSFRFGQSIQNSKGNPEKVTAHIGTKQYAWFISNGYKQAYKIDAHSAILVKKSIPVTAYDVLATITKSNPGSFNSFCFDFGYDTDSKKAEKTYFAVQEEFENVDRLFSDVMEKLQEIQ